MNVLCGKAVFIRAYNSNSSVPRGVSFRNKGEHPILGSCLLTVFEVEHS